MEKKTKTLDAESKWDDEKQRRSNKWFNYDIIKREGRVQKNSVKALYY